MATIVTHQPRPVPAFRRQHSTCIAYPSPPLILNPSQSSLSFPSSMDLHSSRSHRPNRPSHLSSSNHHHIPHTPPHLHHPYYSHQQRTNMTAATASTPFARHTSPSLSSTCHLVYTPSENSYQNTPSMSADLQHEYPFDIGFATGPGMNFADSDNTVVDAQQLLTSQPQQPPSEMLSTDAQQAATEIEMGGDFDLWYPRSFSPPHGRPASPPAFAHPSDGMSPPPPAFGAHVPYDRRQGSSSPPGLTGESDDDLGSESGESDTAELSGGPDGDDDGDFLPHRTFSSRTRSRRSSSVSVSSSNGSERPIRPCRLSAPVPVPNLTKKSRGRRVPTAPVFMVQGGVQKNMRMYKCVVDGCNKCFARGEHLKRHVRSIHTNEKREFAPFFSSGLWADLGDPVAAHKCPVEGCEKDFSRHNDLGQHMRVHKGQVIANVLDA